MLNLRLKQIKNAVAHNTNCGGNILLPHRVFTRESEGKTELLCSLNNKMQKPHYWGHIFYYKESFVSLIVAVNYWLNPVSVEELFTEFWNNLKDDGLWYPISGEVFRVADNFDDACDNLAQIIEGFDEVRIQGDIDFRVVMVYPFPNPFKQST